MAYFNYFIKCIIRNIAYKLCKPKVFLTVLLSIVILFGLKHFGYCAWTDGEIESCLDGLSTITNNQGVVISQLSSMGVNVSNIKNDLDIINSKLTDIRTSTSNIETKLSTVITDIENINVILTQLAQQQNIYYENVTNELEEIKKILIGADLETVDFPFEIKNYKGLDPGPFSPVSFQATVVDNINMGFFTIDYSFEGGYTYDIICNSTNSTYASHIFYTYDTIATGNFISVNYAITSTPASAAFSISPKKDSTVTLIFNQPVAFPGLMTWTITKKSSSSLSGINNTIEQGNQLQQQQNQLQQEQNNFLKDDNVVVDSSTLPGDTTQNITSDGFNSIFQQLYTTFTSGSSQDVVITIPFTNKSFTINSNTVYGNANLGFVKTLIQTFWYFVISYFIVQDIAKKINKIKSGDIEHVQEYNIKEDVL